MIWTANLNLCSILTMWIFYSALITCHVGLMNNNSILNKCNKCKWDNNKCNSNNSNSSNNRMLVEWLWRNGTQWLLNSKMHSENNKQLLRHNSNRLPKWQWVSNSKWLKKNGRVWLQSNRMPIDSRWLLWQPRGNSKLVVNEEVDHWKSFQYFNKWWIISIYYYKQHYDSL